MTSSRWTEVLLARSMQAPLKIRVNLRYSGKRLRDLRFLEPLMNHVERIQEFRLQLPKMCNDSALDSVFSKFSSRAPRLEDLQISVDGYQERTFVLFDGDTPALRTLELSCCAMPWYSLNLSGLTTLSLRGAIPVGFHQNMAEVLSTLNSMQDLTHLYLEDVLASAAGFLSRLEMSTVQKIRLPHLSRLLIVAPVSAVIASISCIDIPLKTQVRIGCRHECGPSLDQYTPLSSLLPQRFNTSSPIIRSLGIDCAEWGQGALTFDTSFSASERSCHLRISILHEEWDRNIPLQVVIYFSPSSIRHGDEGNHVISDICCSLPLTHVQSAHILYPPPSPSFWKRALSSICSIFSLPPASYYDSTENRDGPSSEPAPDRVFISALEVLELHGILFLAPSTADWDVQRLYDALSTLKGPQGRQIMGQHTLKKHGPYAELDMTWKWENGSV
ncbi:hypothetical protein EV363DRAFT_1315098 [Boletus edulis]|nr:hypothetical protein EV363DRAFT_1315098 [Boletus edulis]